MPRKKNVQNGSHEEPSKPHVVLLLHGIRTQASWTEMVAEQLKNDQNAIVIPVRYGFFDVFKFLFPFFTRSAPIRKFVREYRDARTSYPSARISVIAHSFGTYVVTKALESEPDVSLERVIFCGCIVSPKFRVSPIRAQISKLPIVNDCGTHDVWPILASCLTWGFGPTGTFGFGTNSIRDRFHKFTHSSYFDKDFVMEFWLPFLRNGTIVPSKWEVQRPNPPYWQSILSLLPIKWMVALCLLTLLFLPDIEAYREGRFLTPNNRMFLGHWIGSPRLFLKMDVGQARFSARNVFVSPIVVTSPTGMRHVLDLEQVDYCIQIQRNAIVVQPFRILDCSYSYIGDQSFIYQTDAEVTINMAQNNALTLQPTPDRTLISGQLLDRIRTSANQRFMWSEGEWKIEISAQYYRLDGSYELDTKDASTLKWFGTFSLSEIDIQKMKSAIEVYRSGIGVYRVWRDVPPAGLIEVQLNSIEEASN